MWATTLSGHAWTEVELRSKSELQWRARLLDVEAAHAAKLQQAQKDAQERYVELGTVLEAEQQQVRMLHK
jgi:hypothetical protein